jgi:hypothetical protein
MYPILDLFNGGNMKFIFALLIASTLSGCGKLDRLFVAITGDASETCHDGVTYLQFTSGASVKYNADGTIAKCK